MKVLLCHVARDVDVAVLLVEDLDPDESLARHNGLHEAEVEAPDHDDTEYNCQRSHNDPILNVIDGEDRLVHAVVNAIIVLVCARLVITILLLRMVLLEVRVK